MIKRVIDISQAAFLSLKQHQLLIDIKDQAIAQVPIEDIGILILQHPAIVLTQQAVVACQKNNTVILFCDGHHLPYSVVLPIAEGNTLHHKILQQQLAITAPTRKRLWQQIVQQKIAQQAITLTLLDKNATRLNYLKSKVKTGDSSHCEATAAKVYWRLLFGQEFRRDINKGDINSLLNYGYSIMRAMIARSICGAGFHPTLGLFHKNQYNALCLADDLMEPFRPWVDWYVYRLTEEGQTEINKKTKQRLLGLLNAEVIYHGKKMPLLVSSHYLIADLKRCYNKEINRLIYPQLQERPY